MGFSRGRQGHRPYDDDDDEEENDDEVEDNDKDNNTSNDKGISALGLDRDLGFSRGHQGCQRHRPNDDDDDDEVEDNDKENNKPGVFARTSRTSRASAS